MAAECARADVRDERRVWHAQRQPRMREQPHRLVFLDETYVNTKMTRLRGRSRRGQRLRMKAPFGHWKTHTFLAGLRCNELCAPWIIDGPITRLAFEAYVETQLAPTLRKGDVVDLDGLLSTRAARCERLKQRRSLAPEFLPQLFARPEPIEQAFCQEQALGARPRPELLDALSASLDARACTCSKHKTCLGATLRLPDIRLFNRPLLRQTIQSHVPSLPKSVLMTDEVLEGPSV